MSAPPTEAAEPIGGYFELDLPQRGFVHSDAVLLNSGRACLEAVLTARSPRCVHIPRFTCDAVVEPLEKLGIAYRFYSVDERLEAPDLPQPGARELLVVNDYFGLQDARCQALAERFGDRLIVDCSQAWFATPPAGAHVFYSPRKFFGLPDGGCLYSPDVARAEGSEDRSGDRLSHLVKRFEQGPQAGFGDFRHNDASLSALPVRPMSRLTRRLLGLIDHEEARQRRRENFALLDAALAANNRFRWDAGHLGRGAPMAYPYWPRSDAPGLRSRLLERQIFVPTYWPNVLSWAAPGELENRLASEMLPLPVDQRYGAAEMRRILEALDV